MVMIGVMLELADGLLVFVIGYFEVIGIMNTFIPQEEYVWLREQG